MEIKNTFIMISGPAASGKSTLVEGLSKKLPAYVYKPSKSFIDLAIQKKIPIDRAFYDISREDAENHFCEKCKKHNIVVGDQHLSIQHNKDSIIAAGNSEGTFIDEPYVSALDYEIFEKLSKNDIYAFLIYLKASPELLYERAYKRYLINGTYIRNKNLKETEEEVAAEEYYFNELINKVNIDNYIIDTDKINSDGVLEDALQKTLKFRR